MPANGCDEAAGRVASSELDNKIGEEDIGHLGVYQNVLRTLGEGRGAGEPKRPPESAQLAAHFRPRPRSARPTTSISPSRMDPPSAWSSPAISELMLPPAEKPRACHA